MKTSHDDKYTAYVDEPGSTHELVVGLVPPETRVLEFGCASGYMSEVLRDRLGCVVTGVEISPDAAALARTRCARVIVGDVDDLDFGATFRGEQFDVALFADVLEHMREPGRILRQVRPLLSEGGVVVASIPNIAHGSVRLALLAGEFRYRPTGLLDDGHIRFFTRDGITELFEEAGFLIETWLRKRAGVLSTEIEVPAEALPADVAAWVERDPESTTYQFVVRATPAPETSLRRRLERASDEVERASDEAARLRIELAEVAGRLAQVEEELSLERARGQTAELRLRRRIQEVTERAASQAFGAASQNQSQSELAAEVARLRTALSQLQGSKTFRYTAPLRDVAAGIRWLLSRGRSSGSSQ